MKWQVLFQVFINLILFISCTKKTSNNELPTVNIVSPLANESFQYGDTLKLRAVISDDQLINQVDVKVKDENSLTLFEKYIDVNSATYELKVDIVFQDKNWNGALYLDVRAYDSFDYGHGFRFFNLEGADTKRDGFILFEEKGNAITVHFAEGNVIQSSKDFQTDLLKSVLNSNSNELYFCGEYSGSLYATDTSFSTNWYYDGNSVSTIPYFTDLVFAYNNVVASCYDGRILAFDASGNKVVDYSMDQEYRPGTLYAHDEFLIYEKIRKSSSQVFLRSDFYPSGLMKGEVAFNYGNVSAMKSSNWDKVLITSNKGAEHFILEYNSQTHFIEKLLTNTKSGDFADLVSVGNNAFIMIKGSDLYQFDLSSRLLTLFKANVNADLLRYESETDLIWYTSNNKLIAVSAENASEQVSLDFTFEIKSFEIIRN